MKKLITILLLAISLTGGAQTISQLTKRFNDFELKVRRDSTAQTAKNKSLEADNAALKLALADLKKKVDTDTLFLDSTLQYVNKKLGVTGGSGGANKKIIDSLILVSTLQTADIKQLYSNNSLQAKATSDTGKALRSSLRATDSVVTVTRAAMIQYYKIGLANNDTTNRRIDSLIKNTKPTDLSEVWKAINALQTKTELTDEQVRLLNVWADKISLITLVFPKR